MRALLLIPIGLSAVLPLSAAARPDLRGVPGEAKGAAVVTECVRRLALAPEERHVWTGSGEAGARFKLNASFTVSPQGEAAKPQSKIFRSEAWGLYLKGHGAPEPGPGADLNCLEETLDVHLKAGLHGANPEDSRHSFQQIYVRASELTRAAGGDVIANGEKIAEHEMLMGLGYNEANRRPLDGSEKPKPGDSIVMFDGNGGYHVAIFLGMNAAGEHEVYSHWNLPTLMEDGKEVFARYPQRTTVEALRKAWQHKPDVAYDRKDYFVSVEHVGTLDPPAWPTLHAAAKQ